LKDSAKLRYWAKSGKIYFQSGFDLFFVDEKTGEIRRLTDFENRGLQPRVIEVAADELKVAVSIKENDLYKVKVKQFDVEQFNEIAVSKDQIDYVSWHPNGKDVIFSATIEGTYQIFKVLADGTTPPIQLSTGDFDFYVEDVSSRGDQILYWSQNESSDLWMVNTQDGSESLVADNTSSEYWAAVSPDNKSLAYQAVAKANRPFSGTINVKSISKAGTPLTISANGFSPTWSKNSRWVAFFRRTEKELEIWRGESTGGDIRKLTSGGIQSLAYTATPYLKIGTNQLTFSPNGDAIAYAAKRDGKSNIWLVSLDGLRDEPATKNEDKSEILCCPAWTPDSKYFVASSNYISPDPARENTNRLWLYSTENSAKKMIFESREKIRFLGIGNSGKDAVIAFMPDSTVSTPTPDLIYINLVSLETGANSRVNTLSNAYFHNIHLSPDGKTIAFVSRRENVSELWVVPVVGGTPRKLTAENNPKVFMSSLSWSPDGKSIVFGKQSQNSLLSMLIK
jgi:Tol biopolymer transport system component